MARPKRIKSTTEDENTPPGLAVAVGAVRNKRGLLSKTLSELPEDIEYEVRTQRAFSFQGHTY